MLESQKLWELLSSVILAEYTSEQMSHTLHFAIFVWLIDRRTPRDLTEDRSQVQILKRFTMNVHLLYYKMFTVFVLDCFEYLFCHSVNVFGLKTNSLSPS